MVHGAALPDFLGPTSSASLVAGDLTPCFEAVFFPSLVGPGFILAALIQCWNLIRSTGERTTAAGISSKLNDGPAKPLSRLVISLKLTVYAAICCNTAFRVINRDDDSLFIPTGFQILHLCSHTGALALALIEYIKRRQRSNLLTFYWAIYFLLDAVFLRTMNEARAGSTTLTLIVVSMVLAFVALVLEQAPYPESTCERGRGGPLSKLLYLWFFSVLKVGSRRDIGRHDLPTLETTRSTQLTYEHFQAAWEQEARKKGPKQPSLRRVLLFKLYPATILAALALTVVATVLSYTQPMLLSSLLDYFASLRRNDNGELVGASEPKSKGFVIAAAILAASVTSSILSATVDQLAAVAGLKARSALSGAVYRKSLALTPTARAEYGVGEITDRLTDDPEEVQALYSYLISLFNIGLQLVLATGLVYMQLSWVAFVGTGLVLLVGPLHKRLSSKLGIWMRKKKAAMDARVKVTSEMLSAMKVIKLNTMERTFKTKLLEMRAKELVPLKTKAKANILLSVLSNGTSLVAYLVMLGLYSVTRNDEYPLDAKRVFVSLSAFQLLQAPLSQLARQLSFLANAYSSVDRIGEYLSASVFSPSGKSDRAAEPDCEATCVDSAIAIEISRSDFGYTNEANIVLCDVELDVQKGTMTVVLGPTGSGKSSLLYAILGEMETCTGTVSVHGSIAYVAQKPWVINATVRENVVFMSEYDDGWYQTVIKACGLASDIANFQEGDAYCVDEEGANLSGGQKQRLALARAVYSRSDIYLIDDTLSALDSRVAKHVFQQVLGPKGLLRDRTRVFVTHASQYVQHADQILYVNDGRIAEQGSMKEVVQNSGSYLATLLNDIRATDGLDDEHDASAIKSEEVEAKGAENSEQASPGNTSTPCPPQPVKQKAAPVPWAIYRRYIASSTLPLLMLYVFSVLAGTGVSLGSRYWLHFWTSNVNSYSIGFFLGIYAAFVLITVMAVPISGYVWMGICALRASYELHASMLATVLRQPLNYFEGTPVGRVMARFTMDLGMIDVSLPPAFMSAVSIIAGIVANLLPAFVNTPILIAIVVPLGVSSYMLVQYFLDTALSLNRLQANLREPLCSNLSETIDGLATIRAFKCESFFMNRNSSLVDNEQSASYLAMFADRWLSLYSNLLGGIVLFGAAALSVQYADRLDAPAVGLGLSYLISWTAMVTMLVNLMGMMNMAMVGVERVCNHIDMPQEAPEHCNGTVPENWPSVGEIEFKEYSARYNEGAELALKNITLKIRGGEKIGIVGRTGAGKSSMVSALFRIIEQAESSDHQPSWALDRGIFIDGVAISTVGLADLRSRITAIPQEPVLFSGTVRTNLDPEGLFNDDTIWAALDAASVRSAVASLDGGLDAKIVNGSEFLSTGQRQLVCIARAILHRSKIVVMDEATSSIDQETDDAVQRALESAFKGCTVIIIAHRLRTVMNADRILVLDAGQVVEFDTPAALIALDGRFADMLKHS
ncbi:P-loop containing nucleoside triphosphate hydrolase protein [Gaertneriomyces semiglobifer]|nr:P-loop containing nucleoside triphosphate hydrolase protein [Gaertneriomyces semiglobifer]